jgi:hypothetical protein
MNPSNANPDAVPSHPNAVKSFYNDTKHNKKIRDKHRGKLVAFLPSAFMGKWEEIKAHVFDVTPGKNGFDVFAKTTREIGEYMARSVKDSGEFRVALDPKNLGFNIIDPPPDPRDVHNPMEIKRWEIAFKVFTDATERCTKAMGQGFAIILGECSPTIVDRIKSSALYHKISINDHVISLFRLFRTSMYAGATSKDKMHSLIEAWANFHAFHQTSRMTNAEYLHTFKSNIDAVEHLNGDIGTNLDFVMQKIHAMGGDPTDQITVAAMKAIVCKEYIAMHFLHADSKQHGNLIANVQNDYVSHVDKYLKTLSKAFDMLVNYVSPAKITVSDNQDGRMSFYEKDNNYGSSGHGVGRNIQCSGCGCGRIYKNEQDGPKYNQDSHVNAEDKPEDHKVAAINNSHTFNHYSDVSFSNHHAGQIVLLHGLPSSWLLLDSCSTTDIFANANLLSDIQDAPHPIWVQCNAGRIQLTKYGKFGDYPYHVWYNSDGVANILSLYHVMRQYCVSTDSTKGQAIIVHNNNGTHLRFEPSARGLYKHELPTNNISSLKDTWLMMLSVSTVKESMSKFSKFAYQHAIEAQRLQNIIIRPPSQKYRDVILDHLRDSKVTKADIDAAEQTFGPNVGSIKGKTVCHSTDPVTPSIDAVPFEVMKLHGNITLTIDIMFVNKIPFFITKSQDIHFVTIEALLNRQIATVNKVLQNMIALYKSRDFFIESILADHEFEALCPWYPNINRAAANKHVPDIKCPIGTIKDSTKSTYRMLPFRRIPRIVLIHLVKNAVFWINAVPTNDGITCQYSQRRAI